MTNAERQAKLRAQRKAERAARREALRRFEKFVQPGEAVRVMKGERRPR
jgi:hypothetical protein